MFYLPRLKVNLTLSAHTHCHDAQVATMYQHFIVCDPRSVKDGKAIHTHASFLFHPMCTVPYFTLFSLNNIVLDPFSKC